MENHFQGEHAFYTTDRIESPLVTRKVDLGFAFIYFTASDNAMELRQKFSRIDGESVTISNTRPIDSILQSIGAREISTSRIHNLHIVYAYSPRVPTFITKNNARINIQIAVRYDRITIGWPIILGSY